MDEDPDHEDQQGLMEQPEELAPEESPPQTHATRVGTRSKRHKPERTFAFLRNGLPPPPPDLIQGISHSAMMNRVLDILGSLHPDKAIFQHRLLAPPENPGRPSIFVTEETGQALASCATWIVYLVARKHKSIFGDNPMTVPTLEVVLQYLQLEYPSLRDPIDALAN